MESENVTLPEPESKQTRDLGLVLIWVILVAVTLRFVAAIVDAILDWPREPMETLGHQLGRILIVAGDYADGQGVLLLLAVLGLFWWRRSALRSTGRERFVLIWLIGLFGIAAIGALLIIVGTVSYNAGLYSFRYDWAKFLGSGGFYLAYLMVALGGLYVSVGELRRLRAEVPESPVAGLPPS